MDTKKGETIPRIYVASLSDYNAGRLHGRWIDADQPEDAIREEVAQMLAESSEPVAEEWAIHDYEGFAGYHVAEYADLDQVAEVARLIAEHGPVFGALLCHLAGDIEDAKRRMVDGYRGAWDRLAYYAQDLVEEVYHHELQTLPEFIRYHIDYDGIAHDMELNGDVLTVECGGKLHVFDANI